MKEITVKDDVYNKYGQLLIAKGVKIRLDDERELRYSELGILKQIEEHRAKKFDVDFAREHIAEVLYSLKKRNVHCKSLSLISQATEILQEIIIESRNSNIGLYLDILSRDDLSWIYSHSVDVSLLTIMAAKYLKMDESKIYKLGQSTLIHDIGMTLIPKSIMNSPEELNDEDFAVIKNHCHLGLAILKELDAPYDEDIIVQHHERLDGSGYPDNAHGDEITDLSKIVMLADVIDSATTDRPHRQGKSISEVFGEIEDEKEKFDMDVFSVYKKIIET